VRTTLDTQMKAYIQRMSVIDGSADRNYSARQHFSDGAHLLLPTLMRAVEALDYALCYQLESRGERCQKNQVTKCARCRVLAEIKEIVK
jgi:hypothetical protein